MARPCSRTTCWCALEGKALICWCFLYRVDCRPAMNLLRESERNIDEAWEGWSVGENAKRFFMHRQRNNFPKFSYFSGSSTWVGMAHTRSIAHVISPPSTVSQQWWKSCSAWDTQKPISPLNFRKRKWPAQDFRYLDFHSWFAWEGFSTRMSQNERWFGKFPWIFPIMQQSMLSHINNLSPESVCAGLSSPKFSKLARFHSHGICCWRWGRNNGIKWKNNQSLIDEIYLGFQWLMSVGVYVLAVEFMNGWSQSGVWLRDYFRFMVFLLWVSSRGFWGWIDLCLTRV
jgi:hypothetical protein